MHAFDLHLHMHACSISKNVKATFIRCITSTAYRWTYIRSIYYLCCALVFIAFLCCLCAHHCSESQCLHNAQWQTITKSNAKYFVYQIGLSAIVEILTFHPLVGWILFFYSVRFFARFYCISAATKHDALYRVHSIGHFYSKFESLFA